MNPALPSIWRKPDLSQMNLTAGQRMYLACGIGGEPRRWRVEVFAFQQPRMNDATGRKRDTMITGLDISTA